MNLLKEGYKLFPEEVRYAATKLLYVRNVQTNPDMFTSIDVGLDDWCNRQCSYCPVSAFPVRHAQQGAVLSDMAQSRLLTTLKRINYKGSLEPVHYNEPLLRAKELTFPFFLEARRLVPWAELRLYTNGDLLQKYIDTVAQLRINVIVAIHEPARSKTLNFIESGEPQRKIKIFEVKDMRRRTDLWNRTQGIPYGKIWNPPSCPNYDFRKNTLVINPKGNVVTCIQDHCEEKIWGNINETDIMDIWTHKSFWQFREQRRLNQAVGRLAICHACLGK